MTLFFENLRIITLFLGIMGCCGLLMLTVTLGVIWIARAQGWWRIVIGIVVGANLMAAWATLFMIMVEYLR